MDWVRAAHQLTQGQVIVVDGKTLWRSHDKRLSKAAIHMVSAWATINQLVLGQVKMHEDSNEITAIPILLRQLEISASLVTLDAQGCQTEIAETNVVHGADYLLSIKESRKALYEALKDFVR